jgi:outer membrane protein assembly factor BamA
VYLRTTEPPALNIGSYKIKQTGGRVSFGVPFSEVDTIFFGIGAERSRIETDITSPVRFKQYVIDNGGVRHRFGYHQRHAADGGMAARQPRQRPDPTDRPLPASTRRLT